MENQSQQKGTMVPPPMSGDPTPQSQYPSNANQSQGQQPNMPPQQQQQLQQHQQQPPKQYINNRPQQHHHQKPMQKRPYNNGGHQQYSNHSKPPYDPNMRQGPTKKIHKSPNGNQQFQQNQQQQDRSYFKTQLCPKFLNGQCTQGATCNYAHGQQELRGKPNFLKTRLCFNFAKGTCQAEGMCKYAHGQHELRNEALQNETSVPPHQYHPRGGPQDNNGGNYHSHQQSGYHHSHHSNHHQSSQPNYKGKGPVKNKLCTHFMSGSCKNGASCGYAHGEHELGQPHQGQQQNSQYSHYNAQQQQHGQQGSQYQQFQPPNTQQGSTPIGPQPQRPQQANNGNPSYGGNTSPQSTSFYSAQSKQQSTVGGQPNNTYQSNYPTQQSYQPVNQM